MKKVDSFHKSVLLKEVLDSLNVKKGKKYIDATLGGGGHTVGILKRGGEVLGIDVDQEAIDYVRENIKYQISNIKYGEDLIITKGNFKDIDEIARLNNFTEVSGIVFDLGVSSYQLQTAQRGFSFQKEGPLDMRMDKDLGVKALDLVNVLTKGELYELFTKLGEERFSRSISNNIVRARGIRPITTTYELAKIVEEVYPPGFKKINPATKVFQALRIAINDELNNLKQALPSATRILEKGGRLVVISFHSLEDRIVKNYFNELEEKKAGVNITKKPVTPTTFEVEKNPRARSAKLRVFEKH
ncbi:MAG: 16S rRNA (cytosine(1402)-N(4))-methyltransferase RsmH [Patescibacteria group bacterium]|nr:16S rRNA (cytosine(1402)-N(4))-methyltransferase RsmH [Patescibacteria group bacterium]